ncbi:MAG: hypothetical protein RLZZ68_1412 [Bacteroidota bacterium]|jgi:hypothetical protein|nr:hypothetical protein [Flavobacteriia bacterium]NBP27996.1 hypothetical protein [Flavobacteriia bacterium]
MAVECQELKQRIAYGDPFFILYQEHKKGGAIVSENAINRIAESDRSAEKCLDSEGVDVYAASSSYSKGDSYSWFDIRKENFLFSISGKTFNALFPNATELMSR